MFMKAHEDMYSSCHFCLAQFSWPWAMVHHGVIDRILLVRSAEWRFVTSVAESRARSRGAAEPDINMKPRLISQRPTPLLRRKPCVKRAAVRGVEKVWEREWERETVCCLCVTYICMGLTQRCLTMVHHAGPFHSVWEIMPYCVLLFFKPYT